MFRIATHAKSLCVLNWIFNSSSFIEDYDRNKKLHTSSLKLVFTFLSHTNKKKLRTKSYFIISLFTFPSNIYTASIDNECSQYSTILSKWFNFEFSSPNLFLILASKSLKNVDKLRILICTDWILFSNSQLFSMVPLFFIMLQKSNNSRIITLDKVKAKMNLSQDQHCVLCVFAIYGARLFRLLYISLIQIPRWNAFYTKFIDCIDSTTYSIFTNQVYVSRTSNHLGTISSFLVIFS